MAKIKFDTRTLKYASIFQDITNTKIVDCIAEDNQIIYVVDEEDISKAIGKNGYNVKAISKILNKRIVIIGFSKDIQKFILNLIHPFKADIEADEKKGIILKTKDKKTKNLLISKRKFIARFTKKYFDLDKIKII